MTSLCQGCVRLGLNVASTRLILVRGADGSGAAEAVHAAISVVDNSADDAAYQRAIPVMEVD